MSEKEKSIKILESYFELIKESEDESENPEWDRGFQAAIALIKSEYNWKDS